MGGKSEREEKGKELHGKIITFLAQGTDLSKPTQGDDSKDLTLGTDISRPYQTTLAFEGGEL